EDAMPLPPLASSSTVRTMPYHILRALGRTGRPAAYVLDIPRQLVDVVQRGSKLGVKPERYSSPSCRRAVKRANSAAVCRGGMSGGSAASLWDIANRLGE